MTDVSKTVKVAIEKTAAAAKNAADKTADSAGKVAKKTTGDVVKYDSQKIKHAGR